MSAALFFGDAIFPLGIGIVYSMISLTRPTAPLSSRTLMPVDALGDFVRISFTTPLRLAGALVLFQDDQHSHAGLDRGASVHS
jgi:hypothetical protein